MQPYRHSIILASKKRDSEHIFCCWDSGNDWNAFEILPSVSTDLFVQIYIQLVALFYIFHRRITTPWTCQDGQRWPQGRPRDPLSPLRGLVRCLDLNRFNLKVGNRVREVLIFDLNLTILLFLFPSYFKLETLFWCFFPLPLSQSVSQFFRHFLLLKYEVFWYQNCANTGGALV